MTSNRVDDWDSHYARFSKANLTNPGIWYRQRLINDLLGITRNATGCRVLDIGCGQGNLLSYLVSRLPEAEFAGVDKSSKALEIAALRLPNARFIRHDLMSGDRPPDAWLQWATHAVCSEVLEHVDDPVLMLQNVRYFLKPNSRLVITVPGGPRSAFDRYIGHRSHYSPAMLRSLLTSSALNVEWVGGSGFPFFNLYRLASILRGKKLIDQASAVEEGLVPASVRFSSWVFRGLFRLNVTRTRLGWQIAAVSHVGDSSTASGRSLTSPSGP